LNALETVSLPKEYRALVWHVKLTSITILNSEVCGKPKFSLDSDVKNPNRIRTIQKIDIHADGFPTENACNQQFRIKVTKRIYLQSCIQCEDKERFKTRPKPRSAYRF